MANRILRVVIDSVKHCNLRCIYCHPGLVWEKGHLAVESMKEAVRAIGDNGVLELVISGGEPTLHPRFADLPSVLDGNTVPSRVLVTNAVHIDKEHLQILEACNLTRIAVSVDGPDADNHDSARGPTYEKVWRGLELLNSVYEHVTVISVAHRRNIRSIPILSQRLASEGLATQHHICAPSYSGMARDHYGELRLELEDYVWLQRAIEQEWHKLMSSGLFVTFNSYWPATGELPGAPFGRQITLQQLVEQIKGTLIHIRPDGELRLASISWGRETVGRQDLGTISSTSPYELLLAANALNSQGTTRQLPRAIEAVHKFQVGHIHDEQTTNQLLASSAAPDAVSHDTIPVIGLSRSHLLTTPLNSFDIDLLNRFNSGAPNLIAASIDGCTIVFDPIASHVIPLSVEESRELLLIDPVKE
ncbi:MAG: radical SAM protein [bacterium]|nr:radical SAM protein [bacterium]